MDMNLKAFMKAELKERGTVEFPGVATFTDDKGNPVPFIIKQLSMKEIKEIRNLYKTTEVFRDKKNGNRPVIENGQVVVRKDYDAERAGLHIMVDAFVQPKLDDPELMEFYKVNDRLDMPETLFADRNDFRYANKCVMEACGLAAKQDEEETVEKLKNKCLVRYRRQMAQTGSTRISSGKRGDCAWKNLPKCQETCNLPISHQKDLLMIILLSHPTDWQRSI